MIKLRLAFGKNESAEIDICDGELLSAAVERSLKDVPLNGFKAEGVFSAVVNGHIIEPGLWKFTRLRPTDNVFIAPRIRSGDSGQIFKQFVILTATIAASVFLTPVGGATIGSALGVAAVTIGATLLMNSLIPPPVPNLGEISGGGSLSDSQMYAISGQSNQMRRLGKVPKVYGTHRIFPNLAAVPYTELAVDPATGETVQYLYGLYDFGMGVVDVSDLRIGDTPLTTDSFRDFNYEWVDPNRPTDPTDPWDQLLEKEFSYYKGRRESTALSSALIDGATTTQVSDANTALDPQEIILDMIAPNGLYGYSSGGARGERNIRLEIHFALFGTSEWRAYNDLNYVSTYKAIGGTDDTEFDIPLAPLGTSLSAYYQPEIQNINNSTANGSLTGRFRLQMYIRGSQRKLLVPDDPQWTVGRKVFFGTRFLGIIQSIADYGPVPAFTELTMDRDVSIWSQMPAYYYEGTGTRTLFSPWVYTWTTGPLGVGVLRSSGLESGIAVVRGNSTSPVYSNVRFTPRVAGQYQIRIRRVSSYGPYSTSVGDNLTWIGLTTAYNVPPITTDKRHRFLELRIKATDQLNGNIQNMSGIVSSVLNVYDPDTETWSRQVTSNPAWVFVDLLTGEVNKRAVPISRLHLPSILEWAEFCEEVPDPPGDLDSYTQSRFQANFILDYDATLQSVLVQLGGMAQASLNIIDGKYGVLIDKYRNTPVQIFTPRNSRDFSSTRLYGPRPHGVRVKFIDPNMDWEVQEVVVYDNGYDENNAIEFDDLTAFACTNNEQAWRFGRYMIAQNRLRQETMSLLVDFENLVCTRGDYVQITQDIMRVGGTPARVKFVDGSTVITDDSMDIDDEIDYGYVYRAADGTFHTSTCTPLSPNTFTLGGDIPEVGDLIVIGEVDRIVYDCIVKSISPNDDLSANITLIEKADGIYDYESTGELPEYDPQRSNTSRPDFTPPKAVTNLVVADNLWECAMTKSGYAYYIDLVWDMPPGSVFEMFEIWVGDGRGYRAVDTTTSKIYRYEVDQSRLDIEHGFKVVAVSATGKKIQLAQMTTVTATPASKTTPPSNVESLSMMITNQVLQLSWPKIPDCDCFQYIIRFSPETNDVWESSVPLTTANRDVTTVSVQARTGVYFIKAVDFAGNESVAPALALTTIPNLFDLNIIETMNDAPDFDGTLEQTEHFGESVILQEEVPGDVDNVIYYAEGYYTYLDLLDLDEIFSVRLQSQIRADGQRKGELMSDWEHLSDVEHLSSVLSSDWNVALQYRATDVFASMADWEHLSDVDHLNFGAGIGFTEWRDIPTVGDATGRIFQFRIKMESFVPNVTPRLFDATVKADMPDRTDAFENLVSHASEVYEVAYDPVFKGPGTSPNIQISIDDAETGDYVVYEYKRLDGFGIRIYDRNNNQVSRQFDVVAKGFGRRHTSTL